MSNPIVTWIIDSADRLFVNLTGSVVPNFGSPPPSGAYGISGDPIKSPSQIWKIQFPAGTIKNYGNGAGADDFRFLAGSVVVTKLLGPGALFSAVALSYGDLISKLPSGSPVSFEKPFTGLHPQPSGWGGMVYLTFTWASNLADYSTWRYSIDLQVNCPTAPSNATIGIQVSP